MNSPNTAHHLNSGGRRRSLKICGLLLLLAQVASAEVVRIDVRRRDDVGTHERVIGRVYFAIDPKLPANRAHRRYRPRAERTPTARSSSPSDLLFFRPKQAGPRARQRVPRSRQSRPRSVARDHERRAATRLVARVVESRRPLPARAGIRGGVPRLAVRRRAGPRGSRFRRPIAPVEGLVRETHIEAERRAHDRASASPYCASDPAPDRTRR